jgi:GWxTD domain-containing protein
MKRILGPIICCIAIIASGSILQAQTEMLTRASTMSPKLFCTLQNSIGDNGLSRLTAHIGIPYDELQYLKLAEGRYQAEAEITLFVFDKHDEPVFEKTYRRKVTTSDYDSTTFSQAFHRFSFSIDLTSGEYSLLCQVMDLDSKNTVQVKSKIRLRDFVNTDLSVSDLVLIRSSDLPAEWMELVRAKFSKSLDSNSEFFAAKFEVYSKSKKEKLKIEYDLTNFRDESLEQGKFTQARVGYRSDIIIPLKESNLSGGVYILSLKIDDGENKLESDRRIVTAFSASAYLPKNLDDAIDQMRYIAKGDEVDLIKSAPEGKKRELFDDFWGKKDPTPKTDTNEFMDEYYKRVAFTNSHFSSLRTGWKTDMGMVYILFGPPSDIEREPFNVVPPSFGSRPVYAYELWLYFELNRQFVFVDYNGFGEFSLLNPEAVYWDR